MIKNIFQTHLQGLGLSLHTEIWGQKLDILGQAFPKEDLIWQDPIPAGNKNYNEDDIKSKISNSGTVNF